MTILELTPLLGLPDLLHCFSPQHLTPNIYYKTYSLVFIICLLHEGKNFCLFYSSLQSQA